MVTHVRRPLDYYLALTYPFRVDADPDAGYVITFPDLPGCMTQVESADEIGSMVEEVRRLWIATEYEAGEEIPVPSYPEEYSGKFNLRLPRSLHRRLAELAERERVSLNQLAMSLLARGEAESRFGIGKRPGIARTSEWRHSFPESEILFNVRTLLGQLSQAHPPERKGAGAARSPESETIASVEEFLGYMRSRRPGSIEELPELYRRVLRNTLAHPKGDPLYEWLARCNVAPPTEPWSSTRYWHWLKRLRQETERGAASGQATHAEATTAGRL